MPDRVKIENQGYVDLDLSKFFDRVNHFKLLQRLSDKVGDERAISLIHKILCAPIQEDNKVTPSLMARIGNMFPKKRARKCALVHLFIELSIDGFTTGFILVKAQTIGSLSIFRGR